MTELKRKIQPCIIELTEEQMLLLKVNATIITSGKAAFIVMPILKMLDDNKAEVIFSQKPVEEFYNDIIDYYNKAYGVDEKIKTLLEDTLFKF